MKEPRTDWSTTSFSEMSTLAQCEEKWYRKYLLREEDPSGPAAVKGNVLHAVTAEWWGGREFEPALAEVVSSSDDAITQELVDDTFWIMKRYVRFHDRTGVEVVGTEMELSAMLEVPSVQPIKVKAKIDNLFAIDGDFVLRECKSSTRKTALDTATVAPQITLYWWLLEKNGYVIDRVMLDWINTYRYAPVKRTLKDIIADNPEWAEADMTKGEQNAKAKLVQAANAGERPLSDSFDVISLDRSPEQIFFALEWARTILRRREELIGGRKPIKNIGAACMQCAHRYGCWESMSFAPDDFGDVLEVEE